MTATTVTTISKQAAHYRPATDPARSCGTCVMFLATERACTLVRGKIRSADTCDHWEGQVTKGSPDQPRDDHGRFGETGWTRASAATGGGPGPPHGETPAPTGRDLYFQQLRDLGQREPSRTPYDTPEVRGARLLQAQLAQTADIQTPERQALRQRVADQLYGAGAPTKNKEAWIVLGPPAAGKSTVLAEPIAQQRGALLIDSDHAKRLLPEYQAGIASGAVHEESSDIVNGAVLGRAVQAGDNIVLPLVGKTPSKIGAIADRLQERGYQVHAVLNDLPPEKAAQRAVARFQGTGPDAGRFVDPEYILTKVGTNPRQSYELLKGHPAVVDYTAYSNDVSRGQRPRLLESGYTAARAPGGRGGGGGHTGDTGQPRRLVFKHHTYVPVSGKHVRVLVVDAQGRLLLLHWAKGHWTAADWGPVQGKIGDPPNPPDETPWAGAQRELEEETGYGGDQVTWHLLYPQCWIVQLPPRAGPPRLSAEHNAFRWLTSAETAQWLTREDFYAQWWCGRGGRIAKQGPADPHLAALIVHGAQLDDWSPLAQEIAGDLGEAGGEAAVQAFDDLGNEDPGAFRVANGAAIDWARHRAAILVRNVEARTQDGLREIVTTALSEGWSPQELSAAITDDYLFSAERADLIATTELALAHSNGTLASWRATGQVAGKRNLLSPSHAIDDECDDNTDVGVIPIEESFPSGDDGPPYHPRCMCVVVPELVPEEDLAKYSPDQLRDPQGQFAYEGAGRQYTPKGQFAILTAANPGGTHRSGPANVRANNRLARELSAKGYVPVPVTGHYTDTTTGQTLTEPSFLVSGLKASTATALGQRYGQNSVITHQGLHDLQTGQLVPTTGFTRPAGAYTELPGGKKLSMGLDWGHAAGPFEQARALAAGPDWAQRQDRAETASQSEMDAAFATLTQPERRVSAADYLRELGPVKKRHGPRWSVAFEFSPEAWRVMRRQHLSRVRRVAGRGVGTR